MATFWIIFFVIGTVCGLALFVLSLVEKNYWAAAGWISASLYALSITLYRIAGTIH